MVYIKAHDYRAKKIRKADHTNTIIVPTYKQEYSIDTIAVSTLPKNRVKDFSIDWGV